MLGSRSRSNAETWPPGSPVSFDLTRNDIRQLFRRALATTGGNYRAVLQLFGMEPQDYKRLMNFLAAHDCAVDYREFRQPRADSHLDGFRERGHKRSAN